jgi:uncharacterized protein
VRSQLLVGTVAHRRHRPRPNAFRYRVWHLLVDVDEVADLGVPGFGFDRPAPIALRSTDHFGSERAPLRTKVAAWVAGQGAILPAGRLLLVAYPRVVGHVFNPVSWWFAFHPDGRLGLVIAEVRNTFGDWHAYLLDDLETDGGWVRVRTPKLFHVSPFLPVDGLTYRFAFRAPTAAGDPDERMVARLEVHDREGVVLDATQAQTAEPLTGRSLLRANLKYPLVTLRTIYLIHRQAVRLWWRRTPFHRRPAPPPTGLEPSVREELIA